MDPSLECATTSTNYSNKYRKQLLGRINNLSSTEHEEIFNLIRRHNLGYTQNKNGIFFNLSTLPDGVIEEIGKLVDYCASQKKELDAYDIRINECKINSSVQRIDIKKHFEETEKQKLSQVETIQQKLSAESSEKLNTFVEKIKQDRDNIGKKKTNMTFLNAKKRFLKKSGERKIEKELVEELTPEKPVYSATIAQPT